MTRSPDARLLLETGQANAVLGLRAGPEGPLPHLFVRPEELDLRVDGPKYPLAKTAWRILRAMPPGFSLAVVCRACDMRAIREQQRLGQYPDRTIQALLVPCDEAQARTCSCALPDPETPEQPTADPRLALAPDLLVFQQGPDRAALWREAMQRCLKCYGCRNVCPVCVCPECRLEDADFVPVTVLPPPPLPWHVCRATHVAESCVGCGACQDACPAGIPLLALHSAIAGRLHENTGYVSGMGHPLPLSEAAKAAGPTGTRPPQWLTRRARAESPTAAAAEEVP